MSEKKEMLDTTSEKANVETDENNNKKNNDEQPEKEINLAEETKDLENLIENLSINTQELKYEKLKSLDLEGIAEYLLSCKNVIFMTGAGISTAAGIPDFRSPKTGLYANLSKYNLPYPEAVFSIDYFRKNPQPFYSLAKELMPSKYKPTVAHYFQRLLIEKGHVLRVYTQNIDTLEDVACLPEDKVIYAHGSFKRGHCLNCKSEYSFQWMREKIEEKEFMECENQECIKSDKKHNKIVKPDITFFGETLPAQFISNVKNDFKKCDLLIVMGTSLLVQPFGSLAYMVDDDCPRLLINRNLAGDFTLSIENPDVNKRDVFVEGDCDDGCLKLAKKLGLTKELIEIMRKEHERLDNL